jgi:dipeptidyl aminopeptidase/acylaminoacyl peptidase
MLSYAVAASGYYYYARTGLPFAGACAPLAGVPGDMVFKRAGTPGLYRVPAGDSVAIPIPTVTPFSDIGSTFVRWAPDGTRVLATASTADYWAEPIAVTLATLAEDTLARNPAWDGGGSYSPDGTRIAFFSDRASPYLWVMDANGANPIQLQTSTTVSSYDVMNPAWSPNGQRVAFVGYQTCCTQGLWSVLVADGTVRLEFPISGSYPPLRPSWSPAGDSLLFHANNRVYAVAAPDTATAPRPVVSLSGTLDYASWTPAGIVFRRQQGTSAPTTYDYYLRQPDGRIVRVYRPPGTEDIGASFR